MDTHTGKENLNYFSVNEKRGMDKFAVFRTRLLLPVSKALMKLGITANAISYFGLFILIGFVYYAKPNPLIASIFIFAHVFIDGFDGPLARLMSKDGNSGAFTDIVCDHIGTMVVAVTLIYVKIVNPVLASVYIFLYTVLIVFLTLRNRMHVPIKFVIRTAYFFYALYVLYALFGMNYLDPGLIVFNIIMVPPIISSYIIIKRELK